MAANKKLDRGRKAFQQERWKDAYANLFAADQKTALEPGDLESLAIAAYLIGKYAEYGEIWARAHSAYLNSGRVACAVRCAFWLGFTLMNKGERARGSGWIARAQRLFREEEPDGVEQGFLLLPVALKYLSEGDAEGAFSNFQRAGKIGERFRNADLTALSCLGRGQALIRMNKIGEGVRLLDEAMAAVDSGRVAPIVAGLVYCAVIETCQDIFDLRRAQEWTEALSKWCESQPHLVPYRGQCLIRRSEILQLHGAWPKAMEEARRAIEYLAGPKGEPAAGVAFYQLGELYRLQGDFAKAEEAYRQAGKWGRIPQPGLALLRLAQGQPENAEIAIQHVIHEAKDQKSRARALPAYVEIKLALNKTEQARQAVRELAEIADALNAPLLRAIAAHTEGAVHLAKGNPRSALDSFRRALSIWEQLDAPYKAARTHLLMGNAYLETGDEDTATMEYQAARWTFRQLKAKPDIDRVDARIHSGKPDKRHGLTPRELQVIRLIAGGMTNKDIANELFISERTVERHVSNIFSKLNLSSRSAATAYAYEHKLLK